MIVHVTDLSLIERMWPALEPLFAKVTPTTNGCYEPDDVRAEIMLGNWQLWVAYDESSNRIDAAMTTRICEYPRRKSCIVIFIVGSKMRSWLGEFQQTVEQFAAAQGATFIEGFFREGWARVWPGLHKHGVGLVKELP